MATVKNDRSNEDPYCEEPLTLPCVWVRELDTVGHVEVECSWCHVRRQDETEG